MVAIFKNKVRFLRCGCGLGKVCYSINDQLGDREFGEVATFDEFPGDKTEKMVGAPEVACGTTVDGRGTTCVHTFGRIIFFMRLTIGTKWCFAMFFEIKVVTKDEFAWTPLQGDTC
jgi:hypothetical protein